MKYKNYIFDLYATLVDIHTNEKPITFWRRVAAIMGAYGAVYDPSDLRKRYRGLVRAKEEQLAGELQTDLPEIELGDVFKDLILSPPEFRGDGIWGDPRLWRGEELDRWCGAFAYSFRILSRIRFGLYPDTLFMLDSLKREGKHSYLLSNAQGLFTRPEMAEVGLPAYFNDIFISSDHGLRKPEVRFMQELLDKHQLDLGESVMVGNDMNSDILMAARCGVNAILINHDGYSDSDIERGFAEARELVPSGRRGEVSFEACPDLKSLVLI